VKRVKTGIAALDDLLGGGLFSGSTALLIGPVGTLKSYIGGQFIYEGLKRNEPCVFISTVQHPTAIVDQALTNFGWKLEPYLDEGLLRFVDFYTLWTTMNVTEPIDVQLIVRRVHEAEHGMEGGRQLFHSFSSLFNFVDDPQTILRMIHSIKARTSEANTTTLYIVDQGAQEKEVEENIKALCDYVFSTDIKKNDRVIRVTKALTKHGLEWHRFSLTDKGVEVEIVH